MSSVLTGLLGTVKGVGQAVSTISDDVRRNLAQRLRDEAIAELQKESDIRRHGLQKELTGMEIESREGIARLGQESADKRAQLDREGRFDVAELYTGAQKHIADENKKLEEDKLKLRERELTEREKANELKGMDLRQDALKQANEILNEGKSAGDLGTMQDALNRANAVLEDAGVNPFKLVEVVPGKKRAIRKDIPPEYGYEQAGLLPEGMKEGVGREPTPNEEIKFLDKESKVSTEKEKMNRIFGGGKPGKPDKASPTESFPRTEESKGVPAKPPMTPEEAKKYTSQRNRELIEKGVGLVKSAFHGPKSGPEDMQIRETKDGGFEVFDYSLQSWRPATEEEEALIRKARTQ